MDFSLQHINTSIAGLFSILVVYYLFRCLRIIYKSRVGRGITRAPEAGGAWPIIGHLHLLASGSQLPHITLGCMAEKYGPIFTIKLGLRRALVVSSWESCKECFTTNDIAISSRPKFAAAQHLSYNYVMFAFSPYGAYWRELRKIISVELLSNRRLELLKHVRVSETNTSIKELYKLWAEKKNSSSGRVLVEMKQWFGDLTLNVIVRMVAGKRYFGANASSEEARRCQKVLREFFHFLGFFVVGDAFPLLRWLDLGGHEKAMKETAKEMDNMVGEWLEEHRRKRDSGHEFIVDQDFMDVMFSVLQDADLAGGYNTDTINKATCLVLISGGADTTTVMMTWVISLLMNNRDVLKKAQEELDIHVGKQRQVDESDISKLVYLQAIVKETLRLYPATPIGGPREFAEDCIVGGYYVPRGTRLMVNLWKLQRDPRLWSDPLEFRPERFLTTHKDIDVKGQHFELIPFGAGRRICPGTTFGLQLLHLVLASLLHGFDLSTPTNTPIDMTESFGLTNMKATPLELLVSPRLSSNLY